MFKKLIISTFCIVLISFAQNLWVETTQEDFADGTYERNIYASHHDGGTIEFAPRFDLNNDGYIDLFTADAYGPYACIYWGSASGYSPGNTTFFPTTGAANCDAADLNGDGYTDFIVAHRLTPKISIYWGTPTGPNSSFYFDIPATQQARQGIFAADFNKDGYLDIITSQEYIYGYSAIFWGSATGYDVNNRTDLPTVFGVHNIEVADFDWDSWLDILITQYTNPNNIIYWGDSSGFSPSNCTLLPGPGSHGASVADLNRDRYLDLIFTAWDAGPGQSYIYWGSSSGYSTGNMQILYPGSCYGGSAVADINDDGYLDILYHSTDWPRIYWGRASGYSDNDTTYIGFLHTSTGGLIVDLDYDGYFDIFSNTYNSNSYIFWGPSFNTTAALPVNGDHHGMFREIGNVYDRTYREHYISSIFDAGEVVDWGTAEWDDSLPTGTSVVFRVRTGDTPSYDTTWSGWFIANNGDSIPDSLNSQYIQYMAHLKYTNPVCLPCLYEVRISYEDYPGVHLHDNNFIQKSITIFPNPFTTKTKISYVINKLNSAVLLKVFDITGRCVKTLVDDIETKGRYSIKWSGDDNNGRKLPEGVYLIKIKVGDNATNFKTVYVTK